MPRRGDLIPNPKDSEVYDPLFRFFNRRLRHPGKHALGTIRQALSHELAEIEEMGVSRSRASAIAAIAMHEARLVRDIEGGADVGQ